MNTDEKDAKEVFKLRREIAKLIYKHEPHISLSALTMSMALIIVSNQTPFSEESIFKTADSTLRDAVAEARKHVTTKMRAH